MAKDLGTGWIWIKDWSAEDKESPGTVLFRKTIELSKQPDKAEMRISADSRYKLYVNGKLAEAGPSKGDRQVWFMDEVNLLPYLKLGENVLAVIVLRYPLIHNKGNHGIFRTEYPGLFVQGRITDVSGRGYDINADESWFGRKDDGFAIVSESDGFAPLQIYEDCKGSAWKQGWMMPGYDLQNWQSAEAYGYMSRAVSPGNLLPRTIPYLYRKQRRFEKIVTVRKAEACAGKWEAMLKGNASITIPAHTTEVVELTSGEEMTGYLHLFLEGGRQAQIKLLQSEAYVYDEKKNGLSLKKCRDDWEEGHLEGFTDTYRVGGYGTEAEPECYEPFWFRTFRFIRMEVTTGEAPLVVRDFYYTETGYPLQVRTKVESSDESHDPIWEISERTLRRCMHETYEDCPFYEQLQYAMDSRAQILYTYSVAADDRLARKCMDDFRRSQRYDGLLNCSYPNYGPNVIPGFSIYYIMMLYDHMMYFGDKELIAEHMPTVERILWFFQKNLDENGYVKQTGGLNNGKERFWSFIDWTPEWDATNGVPDAIQNGPITMESLLFIMGLQHGAKLAAYLGRKQQEADYLQLADEVKEALLDRCMGQKGMLTDGPGLEKYSQQVQVFAVLTDVVDRETGRACLEETILHKDNYPQCSVAMAFYLFRALEKTGLYEKTDEYWEIWRSMLKKNLTTCVEDQVGERSDCHAWGSLILYELPSVMLGVRPAKPGYEAVSISPVPGCLTFARGEVITPKGIIKVFWEQGEHMQINYEVPAGMEVI